MNSSPVFWPLLLLLAFLMGFVSDRTNLCSVDAVREVLFKRRATVLISFAKVALWVFAVSALLDYLSGISSTQQDSFNFGLIGLFGGLLFGAGAVLNDGCSLHTLVRLGRGNFGMTASIIGLIIGATLYKSLVILVPGMALAPARPPVLIEPYYQNILYVALSIWISVELIRLLRGFSFSRIGETLLAARYQLSPAAALLGIANGILFALVGTWMYSYTLVQGTTNLIFPGSEFYRPIAALLWLLLLAYLIGIAASSISRRGLKIAIQPTLQWFRYLLGGLLMGLGASMVPGGNDVLLLSAIPGLSPHAIPAYLSMLVGIAIALRIQKGKVDNAWQGLEPYTK